VIDPTIPNNAGCYRPVKIVLPEGTIVNARPPAAVNARAVVVRRTVDTLLGALASALPDRIPAASNGHPVILALSGQDTAQRSSWITNEIGTGGMGARPRKDGDDCIQTDTSNAQNIPIEALEMECPVRVGYRRLRRDSGGAGRFRGGVGFEKSLEVRNGSMKVSHRGERHTTAPWGLAGGGAGAMARSTLTSAGGEEMGISSKSDFVVRPGDVLKLWTTGGGGFGDPLERDPEHVLRDVVEGKVSVDAADQLYGVVVSDRAVDVVRTEERRSQIRAERGPITWNYDRGPLGRE
jgi:N-methylhydantoinase B